MGLTNTLSNVSSRVLQHSVEFEEALATLCVMTAPMDPHLASELWAVKQRPTGEEMRGPSRMMMWVWKESNRKLPQGVDDMLMGPLIQHTKRSATPW
nr:probable leucine--tRNA ligase, mitochondrial [Salvelinus alpinus]